MALIDQIIYEGKTFSELTQEKEKEHFMQVLNKYKPLEMEIAKQPKGRIKIRGRLEIIENFEYPLSEKLKEVK